MKKYLNYEFRSLYLHRISIIQCMGIAINRLKVILAEQNKTNKWLAEALGKNESTVSRWCTNENQPSLETFYQIAKILDIDIRDFFNRTK